MPTKICIRKRSFAIRLGEIKQNADLIVAEL
jgi:hypothetical protein